METELQKAVSEFLKAAKNLGDLLDKEWQDRYQGKPYDSRDLAWEEFCEHFQKIANLCAEETGGNAEVANYLFENF